MPILTRDLPIIAGKYEGKTIELIKKPAEGSKLVRGKEYPIRFELRVNAEKIVENEIEAQFSAVNDFFHDLGESGIIKKLIADHGLVIVQDLGSTKPEHYSKLMFSLFEPQGYREFDQVGLLATREKIEAAVSSVGNDDALGKNVNKLNSHQEFSRYIDYPHILTFFAQKAPRRGGGDSTTTHATELFDKVSAKYPEFIKDLYEKEGNHLTQTFNYKVSDSSKFKISWTDSNAFGRYITREERETENIDSMKSKAIKLAHERVSRWVEFDNKNNLIVHQKNSIVQIHPFTKNPIIFSSLPTFYAGYYKSKQGKSKEELAHLSSPAVTYGNGDKIPEIYLDYLFEQSLELEYTHKFADGDILFLDNYSVYHGRNPYIVGDRTVLASFWEQPENELKRPYKPKTLDELYE
ncbi:hypothetical protein CANARDRAFT_10483 [[Candida] arabinofermentans NRRL YB-2248]|uniref:TauD/TfdA-like domain-containing protein n=1 Tax=[Candida] arabinofermentans NRRL YB-2248 TaxID=983967 RepID=A0A1E4SSQ0_9ASCO|nr:hypothetical protein CANARDRAFT_10483 [[Candida] arabinofermentans NRRL YB-2248]